MNLILAASETGFFNFVNIMWLAVGAILTVSLLWVFAAYVLPVLIELPAPLLELMAWLTSAGFVYFPSLYIEGGGAVALALVGCVGLALCVGYSFFLRLRSESLWAARSYFLIVGLLWGWVALLYGSTAIGVITVVALLAFTGSFVFPFIDEVFQERVIVPTTLLTSGIALATFVVLHVANISTQLDVFAPGVFWICGVAYAGSCMTLASRHYGSLDFGYLAGQIIAIMSGVAAIYLGSVYNIPNLQEIGGSFLALYLIEKFFDLPWNKDHWALVSLAFAGLLYAGVRFAETHPQYFLGF